MWRKSALVLFTLWGSLHFISYCCAKGKMETFKQRLEWLNAMWYNFNLEQSSTDKLECGTS